jgi:hypothetical protein
LITLNGEAVEGAHITFSSKTGGPAAFGETDSTGRYALSTHWGEGAVPGQYVVTVLKEEISGGTEFKSQAEYLAYVQEHGGPPPSRTITDVLPPHYKNRSTSGLEATVSPDRGKNQIDFDLSDAPIEAVDPSGSAE